MGLDMYLTAELYIGAGFDHRKVEGNINLTTCKAPLLNLEGDDIKKLKTVNFHAAYWHKANQIHKWFVENCQKGKDECQEAEVSREQLIELRSLCEKTLVKGDPELLSPQSGFFFGSTDIDKWYWKNLQDTVKQLTAVLDDPLFEHCYFSYRSSW